MSSGNIYYYFADHLGSSRVILQSGQSTPCCDADFDPFGGEHIVTNTCPQNYKFTGKERDAESGLDDFEARYYSSQFGRFHSADWSAIPVPVPYADLGNPQTLNLYAYVKNNPLNLTDPTGHIGIGGFHIGTGDARTMELGGGGLGDEPFINSDPISESALEAMAVNNAIAIAQLEAQQSAQPQAQQQILRGIAASETFKTRDEAAKAAEKAALAATNKAGRKWEYGGWILKNAKGLYTYTIPVTFEEFEHFYIGRVSIPRGFKQVADYHTHPYSTRDEGQGLSAADEQHAYNHHRTVYAADTYSRNMYRFTPGVSQYKPNDYCCGVIGDFVVHIPE